MAIEGKGNAGGQMAEGQMAGAAGAITAQLVGEKMRVRLSLKPEERGLAEDCGALILCGVASFIHREEIPQGLLPICVEMACALWQGGYSGGGGEGGVVQSISEGDTTITYQSGGALPGRTVEELLTANRRILSSYRKVVWG